MSWYLRMPWLDWYAFGFVILWGLQWPLGWWVMSARLKRVLKRVAGSSPVEYRFSDTDFALSSPEGSHVLPWTRFKAWHRDSENLYLFYSGKSNIGIVVPTSGVDDSAIQFAIAKIEGRKSASP